jgi:hypothetical protein
MAFTNSSSIFNIYFLIIWMILAFAGPALFLKDKVWGRVLPEDRQQGSKQYGSAI